MKNFNLKNPIHLFACGFGSGLLKPAPGTWGSLAGVLIAVLLWNLTESSLFFIGLTLVSFIAGCHICEKTSRDLNVHDDGRIVWDEIVAIFLMFAFLPEYNGLAYTLTFICFRFFDVLKPYPIRYFDEKLETGLGIMFDDILAAIYALIALHIVYWFI
ncbi:putative phosphatidylglycerophosphatase A [Actinobacillus pleuropneumoniae]|uniref:Phosphatidylglycerophosphatase A n=1 Tax=Actinobacillus pleuropneumoniae serotype 3 (strain JL03) TaxID=434271 RepID=B0BSK6_ACTPJ|nr:phosphatidylglycerophosphatase A [Actinobacillus pleuropneumoniae]ABY68808.1 phosphatidylglycerophosphatase A [Actinobacillus pleuropneumoniae serovar 3 str. JL03]EFM90624.1 Acid phosphatase [Actinobacillus pleuropneumoniae serovar 4 str. M62]KIE93208.1 putative phosphatidylglycerophosphatase A [Actinobacillus pleuropneumoniae]KIE93612.1 putative phosphatidylglycerophosphatase A [Actinobacillus pleuropneumoniae]KIE93808.1 putative phosphatidylglycerophosphatase A [Actinobacillus pleuropneum